MRRPRRHRRRRPGFDCRRDSLVGRSIGGKGDHTASNRLGGGGRNSVGFLFVLGFRAFARGRQANGLGFAADARLAAAHSRAGKVGLSTLGGVTPPGSVFYALLDRPDWIWSVGPVLYGTAALLLSRMATGIAIAICALVRQKRGPTDGGLSHWAAKPQAAVMAGNSYRCETGSPTGRRRAHPQRGWAYP